MRVHIFLDSVRPSSALFVTFYVKQSFRIWRCSPQSNSARLLRPRASFSDRLPTTVADVVDWADRQFFSQISRLDANINVAKACLLVALEEEAAAQQLYLHAEGTPPDGQGWQFIPRSASSASTWSLERLESLAAQAGVLFFARCQELGVVEQLQSAAQRGASDSELLSLHTSLVRRFPSQLLGALNEVLFTQQGYTRMERHGEPGCSLLNSVLESGRGSPAALAIMYREVCGRLGLPMHVAVLEGGRCLLLWPQDAAVGLEAGGERFLVDPYAGGAMYSEGEVRLLFELEEGAGEDTPCSAVNDFPLPPATNRQLLAVLLQGLQDSHWCRCIGCSPEPSLMIPPSLDLALGYLDTPRESSAGGSDGGGGDAGSPEGGSQEPSRTRIHRWPSQGIHLQRALAAAQKRVALLPESRVVRLQYALLLYFSRQYGAAQQELEELLGSCPEAGPGLSRSSAAGAAEAEGSGLEQYGGSSALKEGGSPGEHARAGQEGDPGSGRFWKSDSEGIPLANGTQGGTWARVRRLRDRCQVLQQLSSS